MTKHIYTLVFLALFINASAQIWDKKPLIFPEKSQAWRIRPIGDSIAWTFAYTFEEDSTGSIFYTDSETTVQKTIDGGETWSTLPFKNEVGDGGYFADVEGYNANIACISYNDYGTGPTVYKTMDGGQTWTNLDVGITTFINWTHFYDEMNGIASGDPDDSGYFMIVHTHDGGATWTRIDSSKNIMRAFDDEFGFNSLYKVKGDHIYFSTNYNRLLHSSDRGNSWEVLPTPEVEIGMWEATIDDDYTIYQSFDDTGLTHKLYRKAVSDTTWTEITEKEDFEGGVTGLCAVPQTNALLLNTGTYGDLTSYKTKVSTDRGDSWQVISENEELFYGFIHFSNKNTGYACVGPYSPQRGSDVFLKYNGSPLTGIISQNPLEAEVSIFPNPSAAIIHVSVQADPLSEYWILINDLKGSLLHKEIFNNQSTIVTTIKIDNFPVGEHILTVASKDGIVTKKFVKI